MTQKELKKLLDNQTNNLKIKCLVCYIAETYKNTNNYDLSELTMDNALIFINTMYSTQKVAEILFSNTTNEGVLRAINANPILVANFYNIYNIDCFIPLTDISILMSKEYLNLVPIEWTKKYIFYNTIYYVKKIGKGYSLIEDKHNYFDIPDEYINVFDMNMTGLENALKENNLKSFIQKLSNAKI